MACQDGYLQLTLGTVKEEGQRRAKTVRIRAHRFIMFACIGADQGGLTGKVVMHTCNNKGCMNPAHMLVGSSQQNMVEDYSSLQTDRQRLLADRDVAAG
jgi:spore coat polysaccharide biosynthesis predicted glycosyltransferase SpsG